MRNYICAQEPFDQTLRGWDFSPNSASVKSRAPFYTACCAQDFFRKSVIPAYTDIQRVDRDHVRGIVEFDSREDLKRAIKDLDGAPRLLRMSFRGDRSFVEGDYCKAPASLMC